MKDLLNQDRALSPGLIRAGVFVLGVLLLALVALVGLAGLGTLFSGRPFAALIQILGGASIALFAFLVVRLLSETLMALHRLNDRMTVLGDRIPTPEAAAPKKSTPATTKSDA